MKDFLQALALVLVIEGLVYALFPAGLKRIMARAVNMPEDALRVGGLLACAAGVAAIWLIRS
jgi:uncharacterized protein YjeT (DUF2065 family)